MKEEESVPSLGLGGSSKNDQGILTEVYKKPPKVEKKEPEPKQKEYQEEEDPK